jgi:hypothetical protein
VRNHHTNFTDTAHRPSKNTIPDHTNQISTTNQYEMDKFRFFNSFQLNLWDFAGQWHFVDTFLSDDGQRTMFAHASAMIYVFEVTKLEPSGRPPEISMRYFARCLEALQRHSPNTPVFVLVQKMDLINDPKKRKNDFNAWVTGIKTAARETPLMIFGTSIYEDSLYRVGFPLTMICQIYSAEELLQGVVCSSAHSRSQCE